MTCVCCLVSLLGWLVVFIVYFLIGEILCSNCLDLLCVRFCLICYLLVLIVGLLCWGFVI